MASDRTVCRECGWMGRNAQILSAPNPFDPTDEVNGCPNCKAVSSLLVACQVDKCRKEASIGFPKDGGYVNACGDHARGLGWTT